MRRDLIHGNHCCSKGSRKPRQAINPTRTSGRGFPELPPAPPHFLTSVSLATKAKPAAAASRSGA